MALFNRTFGPKKPIVDNGIKFTQYRPKIFTDKVSAQTHPPSVGPRMSGLPYCGILAVVNAAERLREPLTSYQDRFYTTIGTAVHEIWQEAVAKSDLPVFGDWKCRGCGRMRRMCQYPAPCKKCGNGDWKYEEIEVEYNGVAGHIDMVYEYPDALEIHDLKTGGTIAINDGDRSLPVLKHPVQVKAYGVALEKKYKKVFGVRKKVRSVSLYYQSREKFNVIHHSVLKFDDADRRDAKEVFQFAHDQFHAVISCDPQRIIDARPCTTQGRYDRRMKCRFAPWGECKFLPFCKGFNQRKIAETLTIDLKLLRKKEIIRCQG